jgi:hypothetical protein
MALFSDAENAKFDFLKVWSQNGTWVDIDLLAGSAAVQNNGVPVEGDSDDATWNPNQPSKIQWKFKVYIDFIGAILEGIDEFEIAITSKKKVRVDYFSGEQSPVSVSQDIRSYIKRFKQSVEDTNTAEEYVSKTFGITEFIDDQIVSDISNGIINKKNKNSKYPEMEVTYARKIKGRKARKYRKNYGSYPRKLLYTTEGMQDLSRRLFNDTGTDPATVGFIEYPIIADEDLESGAITKPHWHQTGRRLETALSRYPVDESGKSTVSTTDIGANESSESIPDSLYQLYNKFVKIDRSRKFEYYDVRKKKVKVKYIPVVITIDQIFEDSQKMLNLLKKRSVSLEIQWKSKGLVVQTEKSKFNPADVVSKLAAAANKYRAQNPSHVAIRPSTTRRDRVDVRCYSYKGARPEVEEGLVPWTKKTITIFCSWPMIGNRDLLNTMLVSKELLRGGRVWRRRPSSLPFFGTKAYPRSFRISTTDAAGKGRPLSNINWITSPKRLTISPDNNETDNPSALMIFAGPETARVLVGGIPSTVTHVKFIVKKIGTIDSDNENSFSADGKKSQYTRIIRKPKTRRYSYRMIGRRVPLEDGATYQVDCKFYVGGTLQEDLAAQGVYTHYAGINSVFTSDAAKRLSFNLAPEASTYSSLTSTHQMTLSQTIAATTESDFLSQVNADGEATLYSTELEEGKTETAITVQYNIERINWNTGRVEIISSDLTGETVSEYMEANEGKGLPLSFSVTDGQALDRFSYVVKANVTESAAMSYTTIVKEIDVNTGNQYLYRYRKWRNDEISAASGNYDKGVLPPVQKIAEDSMSDAVNKSVSGLASATTFTPGNISPRLRYVNVVSDDQNSTNWITWRIRGDESMIDHFVITAKYNGFRAPIGVAAPIKNGNQYLFSENKLSGIYGEVEYKVYIILKDHRCISSRKRAIAKKVTNIPTFAMVRKRRRRRGGR